MLVQKELKNGFIGEYVESRTPGANTLAYYPLTSTTTVSDESGNSRDLTNNGILFGTYQGVNCAYNSTAGAYLLGDIGVKISDGDYTINIRTYKTEGNNESYVLMFGTEDYYKATILIWTTNNSLKFANWWDDVPSSGQCPSNVWNNIVLTFTKSNRNKKIYINGVLNNQGTANASYNLANTLFSLFNMNSTPYTQTFYGCLSRVIIENKVRTAQEVTDYYNLTKSNYGL